MLDQFVHPHAKAPWLNLVVAVMTFGFYHAVMINSYQAEGGICWKTFAVAVVGSMINGFVFFPVWWLFILPFLVVLCNYAMNIFHGYKVMKASENC